MAARHNACQVLSLLAVNKYPLNTPDKVSGSLCYRLKQKTSFYHINLNTLDRIGRVVPVAITEATFAALTISDDHLSRSCFVRSVKWFLVFLIYKTVFSWDISSIYYLILHVQHGNSALHHAVMADKPEAISKLVELGLDVNIRGKVSFVWLFEIMVRFSFLSIIVLLCFYFM